MTSKYQWSPHWAISMNKVLDWLTGRACPEPAEGIPTDIYTSLVEKAHRGDFDIDGDQGSGSRVQGSESQPTKRNPHSPLLALLEAKIKECEEKARISHARRKYLMYGYWKAIAVHFRKIKREFARNGGR